MVCWSRSFALKLFGTVPIHMRRLVSHPLPFFHRGTSDPFQDVEEFIVDLLPQCLITLTDGLCPRRFFTIATACTTLCQDIIKGKLSILLHA